MSRQEGEAIQTYQHTSLEQNDEACGESNAQEESQQQQYEGGAQE